MTTRPHGNAYDVIVVGLGGMGSAAAYHLARRGQRVLGLERFTPAHDQGSSHGGSRLIRQAHYEDPAYVSLVLRAYELWHELERDSGTELLLVTGGLLLGPPGSRMIDGARESATAWDLAHEILTAADVRRRFPTLAPKGDTVAFFEPTAGLVRPEVAVATHVRLAEAAGADLHFLEPVTSWVANAGGGVTVATGRGAYQADRLVLCPGAWAPSLLADLGIPFAVERQVQTWFQPEGGITPFLPDRHPVWLWDVGDGGHPLGFSGFLYGVPAIDGPDGGVKLSHVSEAGICRVETIDRVATAAEVEAAAGELRPRLAVALGQAVRASVCMWTNTPDHRFVLAVHPRHPQVAVAAGCSGRGFKFVPVIGEILADLAIHGKTSQPIALFDPLRPELSGRG